MKIGSRIALLASAIGCCALVPTLADDFTVAWWTYDAGGVISAAGGDYELSGTIGQPEAGVVMTGGGFELSGGFWMGVAAGPAICPGDTNCDGQVDFADINPFVDALVGGVYCDGTGHNADVNGNGGVGFEDINPFVELLTTNTLPINCP